MLITAHQVPSPAGLLELIDRAISMLSDALPHFCGSIPCPAKAGDPSEWPTRWSRLGIFLEGEATHIISIRGRRSVAVMKPGVCIYWAPNSLTKLVGFTAGHGIDFTPRPDCLRITRFVVAPDSQDQALNFVYEGLGPLGGAGLHVARALDCLAEQGDPGPPARDLILSFMRLVRQHLLADRPVRQSHGRAESTWQSVNAYLDENFQSILSRKSVAEAIGLHPNYLTTLARQMTGRSFRDLLQDVRMRNARRLLKETDLKLARVAATCGYRNVTYFSRAFRRSAGVTPGNFRNLK